MSTFDLEQWGESKETPIILDKNGRIVDFLDEDIRRENSPEERIRQRTAQVLSMEYGYPKAVIAFERSIQMGRERKRADIVVYDSIQAKVSNDQGKIHLIVETKEPSVAEPDGQLLSYLSATSATGGFWTNGSSVVFYRKDPNTNHIVHWIGVPKYKDAWDSVGRFKKRDLIKPIDLKIAFRRCHNAIYRTGIDSEDVALDMVRIILAKIEDESSDSEDCQFYITAEEYSDPVRRGQACSRVRQLFAEIRARFPDVFVSHEEITASDEQLATVISYLQPYTFLDASYDVIGTAYEVYVASHLKGERGQYFTNRLVVNMMVRMLDPSESDIILDPACGSGGFLISSMNYLFKKIDESKRSKQAKELVKRNVRSNIFGVDTTPKLVKVAKANMLISKDGHTGIIQSNSLSDFSKLPPHFTEYAGKEKPTIILTNPPFGAGHDLRIREESLLKNFRTGRIWTIEDSQLVMTDELNTSGGVAPEILFMERCIDWLKPGGKLAIVMAKGQLDNREAFAMRKLVFDTCQVLAVVNLHEDTFEPFVGAKASVIFLRKLETVPVEDYPIFMAVSIKVGQTSRGEPIYRRSAEGDPLIRDNAYVLDEDLSEIAEAYHRFVSGTLDENEYLFSTMRSDINADSLSLNPVQYLPAHNAAVQHVLAMGETEDIEIVRLGDIAKVFNGPRFKRPYADVGVTEGDTIRKYFTGTALTQLKSENLKYLDSRKASPQTKRHLEDLTIFKGYILVSDSGTLGRVTYALNQHDGHVATNNLIRVVIDDELLRGYIYQFLRSDIGQKLMLKNAYGTNQEHLEPDAVANIPIPILRNRETLELIGQQAIESIDQLERSIASAEQAQRMMSTILSRTIND